MSENAPATPPPPTPTPPAAVEAPPAPTPAGDPKPANPQALAAAVRRTVALKGKEAELARREEALKPILELEALAKSNPAEAFKRLTGENFIEAYKSITNDVVGTQDDAAALAALPKSVKERLARLEALEKQAPIVEDLQKRLGDVEKRRQEAEATLLTRQRQEVASRTYATGMEVVKAAADEVPLALAHPEAEARIQAAWATRLKARASELAGLTMEQRQQIGSEEVLAAARDVQTQLEAEAGWVLQTPWAREKMLGVKSLGGKPRPSSAPAKTSASTQAATKPPRTGTPDSLGEPSAVDLRNMTPRQRIEHLKALERAGSLYTKR